MSDSSLTGRAWRRFARQFQLMLHELFAPQPTHATILDLFDLSRYSELRKEAMIGNESYLARMKMQLERICLGQSLVLAYHDVIMDEILMQGSYFTEGALTGDADEEAEICELILQDVNDLLKARKRLLCLVRCLDMLEEWFEEGDDKIVTTILEATIGAMWEMTRSSRKVA